MPIIFWHGEGWHMRGMPEIRAEDFGLRVHSGWAVEFDDEENATWFALIWG